MYNTRRELLRKNIRTYIRELREKAALEGKGTLHPSQLEQAVFTDTRQSYLHGQIVDRLVVFLRGTGCKWIEQTGGCTFCGFWNATNFGIKIPSKAYMKQLTNVINTNHGQIEGFPIVCLYNDGSMLVEEEISFNVVQDMCRLLSQRDHIQRIVLEAKVIDISEEKVVKLTEAVSPKEFEIAVGFESIHEIVQDLCINKTFSIREFETKCRILKRYGASLVPLIIVKPPFLTEFQAIDDAVRSLIYLESLHLQRIDLELATIEKHTLMHDLWRVDLYSTARLWSIIEILKRKQDLGLNTPIYVSPPHYTVKAYDYSLNCPKCTPDIIDKISEYNESGDSTVFDAIECSCKEEWHALLKKAPEANIRFQQIEKTFQELLKRRHDVK